MCGCGSVGALPLPLPLPLPPLPPVVVVVVAVLLPSALLPQAPAEPAIACVCMWGGGAVR